MKIIKTENYKKLKKKAMDVSSLPDGYKAKILIQLSELAEKKLGRSFPKLLKAGLDLQQRGRIDPKTCDEASDDIEVIINFSDENTEVLSRQERRAFISSYNYLVMLSSNPESLFNDGLEEQWS